MSVCHFPGDASYVPRNDLWGLSPGIYGYQPSHFRSAMIAAISLSSPSFRRTSVRLILPRKHIGSVSDRTPYSTVWVRINSGCVRSECSISWNLAVESPVSPVECLERKPQKRHRPEAASSYSPCGISPEVSRVRSVPPALNDPCKQNRKLSAAGSCRPCRPS